MGKEFVKNTESEIIGEDGQVRDLRGVAMMRDRVL